MRFQWIGLMFLVSGCSQYQSYLPMNGDIVFQVSQSSQSAAIQLATDSPYSHMGIIYLQEGQPFVFEAVQPVKLTPFDDWVASGKGGHFVAKRLRDAESILTQDTLRKMQGIGESFIGKKYDLYFEWSDDRIYCSELVWKIFQRGAGIEIGKLGVMGDFDLSHPNVQTKLKERFGSNIPLNETVIPPSTMFNAPELYTVYEN